MNLTNPGTPRRFGALDGAAVDEITIGNNTLSASVIGYGAALRDLRLAGRAAPLVLGFGRLEDYVAHSPHFGATAGRFANRIGNARFRLDGVEYRLDVNQPGGHHLHGGSAGFGKRIWQIVAYDARSVTLELVSADGDQGYPGAVRARCRYMIDDPARLCVTLSAETDAPTVVNLAHHSYFTLAADAGGTILDHRLRLAADAYTPVDDGLIPSGEILPVAGTPYDFRQPRPIRHDAGSGKPFRYDINYVLADSARPQPAFAARLEDPDGGLAMEVWTTEPGLQLYDGAKLDVSVAGLDGRRYGPNAGVCFEAQRFPDTPNRPAFGDATLRPGETYLQRTEYRFGRTGSGGVL